MLNHIHKVNAIFVSYCLVFGLQKKTYADLIASYKTLKTFLTNLKTLRFVFMKKIKLRFITVLMIISGGFACSQTLYGLKKTENGSSTIPFDVVSIDPMTGSTSIVLSTNSLIGVAAGATTYDQQNRRYICWGFDTENNQQLYVMDMDDLVTNTVPFNTVQPIEMEYDLQAQKAYGLWWDRTAEHFGEIDLTTGIISSIAILQGVEAVAIGNSTFDSNTGTYIFIGVDGNDFRLYSIDAATGAIINAPAIWQNNNRFSAIEFNNQNGGALYGLYQDVDYDNYNQNYQNYYTDLRLAEIDLTTGESTLVDPDSSVIGGYLAGYALGGLCFDQQTQQYIIWVQNETGAYLKMVDVATASIVASTSLNSVEGFYELQVDNSNFANNFYNLSATSGALDNLGNELIEATIYPVPAKYSLAIDSEEHIKSYSIYSAAGALITKEQNFNSSPIKVDHLTQGYYLIVIKTLKGLIRKSFIIQ